MSICELGRRLRERLARLYGRARQAAARRAFEVRVWNEVDPRDALAIALYAGEDATLGDSVLGSCGSHYLARDSLELYSPWGLRVTRWRPRWLYLSGIRRASLVEGRRRLRTVAFALRLLALGGLAAFAVYLSARPGSPAPGAVPWEAPAGAAALAGRCPPRAPCLVAELRSERVLLAGIAATDRVVIPGFGADDARVPRAFLPVLSSLFRAGTGGCDIVLLVGRASPGGSRERNRGLARRRADAVRRELETAGGARRRYVTLLSLGGDDLGLDLGRLRRELERSGIAHPPDRAGFERWARRSVEVGCLDRR